MTGKVIFPIISFSFFLLIFGATAWAGDCTEAQMLSHEADAVVRTEPGKAVDKLEEAVKLCPQSAAIHYNLGMAYYYADDVKRAKESLSRALMKNPDLARAANSLAYILATSGGDDEGKALDLAQRAVHIEPQNTSYMDTLKTAEESFNVDVDTAPATTTGNPHAIAIVIGNSFYESELLPSVTYAGRDATAMKNYLVSTMGYRDENVILLRNATLSDFRKHFGDESDHKGILYKRAKEKADVFVFYSGHGAPDTKQKRAYLVPTEADPFNIGLTGYSLDTLYKNLAAVEAEKKPGNIAVVMDSCFSGGYNGGMIIPDASPIMLHTDIPLLEVKSAVVITSSQGNQISSWYKDKRHGLFSYVFLKAIKDAVEAGRPVTVAEIERAILGDDGVNDQAWKLYRREQVPTVSGNKDFAFVEK